MCSPWFSVPPNTYPQPRPRRYLFPPDELNAVICVSQQIGTLALTKSFASSSCIDSIYAPAVLLPWTTREAATMIILHDNTQMPVVQRQLSCVQGCKLITYLCYRQEAFCVLILTWCMIEWPTYSCYCFLQWCTTDNRLILKNYTCFDAAPCNNSYAVKCTEHALAR